MLQRRQFLKRSSLIALAPSVPAFLARTAHATPAKKDDRVLVVLQLDGGNDGINTVVPFADEGYARHRKELRIPEQRLSKINDHVGLHPSLREMAALLEDHKLAIVQGVGYPNPNRSHAVSMAIWQTCRFDPEEQKSWGWLGRALDGSSAASASALLVGDQQPPIALRGRRSVAAAISQLDDYRLTDNGSGRAPASKQNPPTTDDLTDFVRRSLVDAYALSARIQKTTAGSGRSPAAKISYPATGLGRRLELVSRLIKADWGARVYYVVQSGYDTHAAQLLAHSRLLRELSQAVKAFTDDMSASGISDRTMLMTFSEFGRRVAENASVGTDHGTAGPMFLAGSRVKPSLIGAAPSLTDLAGGDLKHSIDFRRVYSALLTNWLGVDSQAALDGQFEPLKILV